MQFFMDRKEESLHEFGKRLTFLREKRGFTIEILAARSGLDAGLIGRIEAGEFDFPITMLYVLAEALGVSMDELLG